ncbi:DUF397 domain-containing protein [Nocardia sp. IFM 10818]
MTFHPSGVRWFKSSYSGSKEACVEIAFLANGNVGVRDSKNPRGPALIFAPGEWDVFTASVAEMSDRCAR